MSSSKREARPGSGAMDPIAVLGYSCLFPGDAIDAQSFWKMMVERRSAMTEVPESRMSLTGWYHPAQGRRGQFYSRGGNFLRDDISCFDAPFFSLSAAEASALDPQQRHLLEVTYRALENAGMPIKKIAGSRTSVHVGCFNYDYKHIRSREIEMIADYDSIGVNPNMNADRLSWFFDFRGASMVVDTACSSSLVALHLACHGLLNGDADMGIVSGANLILSPESMLYESNASMLSPDSISYSFDRRANGFSRGEGTATLVIKRLSDAIRDGDTIRAVIRSTGCNQNGRSASSIMQPAIEAQATLIRDTYTKAGLSMQPTRFFEAHGTGTSVGDPIEMNALCKAFAHARGHNDPLIVGALKANIGHLEGASGIAGIIKVIMILESGLIPPNSNFEELNPKIDPELLGIKLPLALMPWPTKGLRRASVNSFGIGGSNAHVVLDDALHFLEENSFEANHRTVDDPPKLDDGESNGNVKLGERREFLIDPPRLLVFSAYDEAAIKRLAAGYKSYFNGLSFSSKGEFESYMADLAHTLNTRRSLFPSKRFLIASSLRDLRKVDIISSVVNHPVPRPALAFVFTGQGAQWAGMGRELFSYPMFSRRILDLDICLKHFGCKWSLTDVLTEKTPSNIHSPEIAQTVNSALQIALVDLLVRVGVCPLAVVGHSSGEIAAAYTIGALSAEEAMRIAYFRGLCAADLVRTKQFSGAMIAVGLSEDDVRPYMDQIADEHDFKGLQIACINSQRNVTISGQNDQVDALACLLHTKKVFARKLMVPVAYHSSYVEEISSTYRDKIQSLGTNAIPFSGERRGVMISSVTGRPVMTPDLRSPEYWVQNLVSPVQFARAFKQVCTNPRQSMSKKLDGSHRFQLGINFLLEIGPHSALEIPIRDMLETLPWGRSVHYTTTIRRSEPATDTFLNALGYIYSFGCPLELGLVNQLSSKAGEREKAVVITNLPQYPFDHSTSFWREGRIAKRFRLGNQGKLDLLGKPIPDWNELEAQWRNHIRVSEMPWVEDHVVDGTLIYPAAGMLAMAIEAANQTADLKSQISGFELKDIRFMRALVVPKTADGVETSLHLRRLTDDGSVLAWAEFRLFSYNGEAWEENCRGLIKTDYELPPNGVEDENRELDNLRQEDDRFVRACNHECNIKQFYQTLRDSGFEMGATFQTLQLAKFSTDDIVAWAKIKVFPWPASQYPQPHIVHPTTLDGVLQTIMTALTQGGEKMLPTAVPTSIQKVWVAKNGLAFPQNETVIAIGRGAEHNRGYEGEFTVMNESKTALLLQAEGIRSTIIADRTMKASREIDASLGYLRVINFPDLDFLNSRQLATYCAAHAKSQQPEPVEYYRELDFVLYKFLSQVLAALDLNPDWVPPAPPYLKKYVAWAQLQQEMFTSGRTPVSKARWAHVLEDEAYFKAACKRVASSNAQGYAFVRTGQNLLSILRGEQDVLQFLFSQDMMPNFYQEFNTNRVGLNQWEVYLKTLVHKNPEMKILEIGAGTGGSTARVLKILYPTTDSRPLYRSYDYTDISPAFFEHAVETYKGYPQMHFRTLDIEDDVSINKFELGSYDLIIAGSVLHATRVINHTMQNVRKLLKSGGKLMMYEPVRPDIIRSSFIGGLMEGWWLHADDRQALSPLLTEAQWDVVLRNTGFSGIDVSLYDYQDHDCWECSVLLTTAVTSSCSPKAGKNVCFVADPSSPAMHEIFGQAKAAIASHLSRDIIIEMCSLEDCVDKPALDKTILVFIGEIESPFLHCLDAKTFHRLHYIVSRCANVLWVTAGGGPSPKKPEYAIVDGWTRTLRNEMPSKRIVTLALDVDSGGFRDQQLEYMIQVLTDVVMDTESDTYEPEFIEVDEILHIPRVYNDSKLEDKLSRALRPSQSNMKAFGDAGPVRLAIEHYGLLDTLYWTEDLEYEPPQLLQPDQVEVQVQAAGVNLKDCLIALGRMPGTTFGMEFSGIVTRAGQETPFQPGNRVVGCSNESFKKFVRNKSNLICRIPESMTFSEAAAVPVQFSTAWHVIHDIARLQKYENILIHSAAEGTGQAALQIAQLVGAEIYATVGSKAEKESLIAEYGVAADHVFYSRSTSFARGIMQATKSQGINVIINSLSGDLLRTSWECIAVKGRFVDLVEGDINANNNLPIGPFHKNATFTRFNYAPLLEEQPQKWKNDMEKLLQLFVTGQLHVQRPLQVLSIGEVEQAFRMMQNGKEAGKIVLQVEPHAQVRTILKPKLHRCSLHSNATYLVVGGLGGLGRRIARWMVSRGARNLVLLGRSGATSAAAVKLLGELRQSHEDIRVEVPPCDVADATSVQRVLQYVTRTMPPIRGCIYSAMVLRDVMFANMNHDDWRMSLDCKVQGSHNVSVSLPADLDFFVLLSSASGLIGSPGQSNYAAGNTYLDGLARSRVAMGQKAVSVDLGAMAQDGFLAESPEFLEKVLGYGTLSAVSRSQFLAVLDYYCDATLPLLTPTEAQVAIGIPNNREGRMVGVIASQQLFRLFLRGSSKEDPHVAADAMATTWAADHKKRFAAAKSLREGRAIVFQGLVEKLKRAGNLVPGNLENDRNVPIQRHGLDSLLAVEISNWIRREFCADIAVFELMAGETLSAIGELVARRSNIAHANWGPG